MCWGPFLLPRPGIGCREWTCRAREGRIASGICGQENCMAKICGAGGLSQDRGPVGEGVGSGQTLCRVQSGPQVGFEQGVL